MPTKAIKKPSTKKKTTAKSKIKEPVEEIVEDIIDEFEDVEKVDEFEDDEDFEYEDVEKVDEFDIEAAYLKEAELADEFEKGAELAKQLLSQPQQPTTLAEDPVTLFAAQMVQKQCELLGFKVGTETIDVVNMMTELVKELMTTEYYQRLEDEFVVNFYESEED